MKKQFIEAGKKLGLTGVALVSFVNQCMAAATPIDMSPLTGAIDVSTIITGILAVGAIALGPDLAKYAFKKIKSFF